MKVGKNARSREEVHNTAESVGLVHVKELGVNSRPDRSAAMLAADSSP